jgi:hypothetical protein
VRNDADVTKGFGIALDIAGLHASNISQSGLGQNIVTGTFLWVRLTASVVLFQALLAQMLQRALWL